MLTMASLGTVGQGEITQASLPAILSSNVTLEPGPFATLAIVVLPQFLAFYLLACWNDLDQIFSARQPWIGLASPNPAHLNLTLNYLDSRWRLWKALINKHYLIALLSFGSLLSFLLPVLTSGLAQLETGHRLVREVQGKQNYTWATQPQDLAVTGRLSSIPMSAIDAIIRPPGNTELVVNGHVVLPVELDDSDTSSTLPPGTFWQMQTTSLYSKLNCTVLGNSTIHYGVDNSSHGYQPQGLNIVLPPGIFFGSGANNLTIESCSKNHRALNASQSFDGFSCFHWIFQSIKTTDQPEPRPAWVITTLLGQMQEWHAGAGPMLKAGFSTYAFLCEPHTYVATGVAEIVEITNVGSGSRSLHTRDFRLDQQEELDTSVSRIFGQMLNRSIHAEDTSQTQLTVPQESIEASTFIGDLPGYLVYRRSLNADEGMEALSGVYGALFAYTLTESDWLRRNASSSVKVEQWQWIEIFRVRKVMLIVVILIVCFFISGLAYVGKRHEEYLFPIAPESLENSLFFLYQSTIVDLLQAIPRPETLSIETFHKHVENLGYKYVFGKYEDGDWHYEQFVVDRVDEFGPIRSETRTSQQTTRRWRQWRQRSYRDESSESESGSENDAARKAAERRRQREVRRRRRREEGCVYHNDSSDSEVGLLDDAIGEESERRGREMQKYLQEEDSCLSDTNGDVSPKLGLRSRRELEQMHGALNTTGKEISEVSPEDEDGVDTSAIHTAAGSEETRYRTNERDQQTASCSVTKEQENDANPDDAGTLPDRAQQDSPSHNEIRLLFQNARDDSSASTVRERSESDDLPALKTSARIQTPPRALSLSDFLDTTHLPEPRGAVERQPPLSLSDFPDTTCLPDPGDDFDQRPHPSGDVHTAHSSRPRARSLFLSLFPAVADLPDPGCEATETVDISQERTSRSENHVSDIKDEGNLAHKDARSNNTVPISSHQKEQAINNDTPVSEKVEDACAKDVDTHLK
ncbi:hypothetical protein GGR58DRAFT_23253 [Xylaria digitata]|nr:hypothetical protein GGR58DRAFT_23253 [Xylaria digitata]